MNCRDIEALILAEKDGVLTPEQQAALAGHVSACPGCRQFRDNLSQALSAYQADAAALPVPPADSAWRDLQAKLHPAKQPTTRRPLAPVVWLAAPLAAAAALAVVFFTQNPIGQPSAQATPALLEARADFVEAGDAGASTMVYVDHDSGWLVVWADDPSGPRSG